MASCQQQKPLPQPKDQPVCLTCKAYHGEFLGIENGSVEFVDSPQKWLKVPVIPLNAEVKAEANAEATAKIEIFLLVKDGKALAHGVAGTKLYVVPYNNCATPAPNVIWGEFASTDFKHISAGRDSKDAYTHVYGHLDVNKDFAGTKVVVNAPNKGDSQLWKISPYE